MQVETDEALILLKTTLYKNTALQTYKRGLMKHGRLGEIIYVKNPATMEQAMSQVLEYQNWQYQCGLSAAPQIKNQAMEQITPGATKMPHPGPSTMPTRMVPIENRRPSSMFPQQRQPFYHEFQQPRINVIY